MSSEFTPETSSFVLKNVYEPTETRQKFIFKVQKHPDNGKRLDSDKTTPYQKKLGRKQDNTKPVSKRIEQNRIAQRAFRERRENYIKSLESKVKDLEDAQLKTKVENEKLLSYLQSLEQKTKLAGQSTSASASITERNVLTVDPLKTSNTPQTNQVNCNITENNLPMNSSSYNVQNQFLTQSIYDSTVPKFNTFNPTSNASNNNSNFQREFMSSGQQPVMNLVNDYMFPDVTAISSGLPFQPAATTNTLSKNTYEGGFVSSFMHQGSLPYNNYLSPDYYPASTAAVTQAPEAVVTSQIPPTLTSDVLTSDSSPLIDPLEIMNPNRLPPTPHEIYRLAVHHKMMTEKMRLASFTIDDLCDAMRKNATCSAVHQYLTSYLGQDPLQLV